MSWLSKAIHGNVAQAILDPAGTAVRAITNKGDTSTSTLGQFLDPAGLGAGKFTDAAIGGGQLQGKFNTSDKPSTAAITGAVPGTPLTNPFSQFFYQPGVGYMAQSGGPNPFAGVMSSIPAQFFRSPQAFAALSQILNQTAPPSAPTSQAPGLYPNDPAFVDPSRNPSRPGPDPSGTTMYNSAGGFGNGGGAMNLGNGMKKIPSPWVRAL